MRPIERLPHTAAIDRPRIALPDGKRVAVWLVVNVENWLIENPMPRRVLSAPTGAHLDPDIPNWGWHEYGMRVGFWRVFEAISRHGIRPTAAINGSVCTAYPRIAGAMREAGWEFMGHGFVQMPIHRVEDQRRMIGDTAAAIRSFTGEPCVGWLGCGLTETFDTPEHLAEAGIRYVGDWVVDDRPCRLPTKAGPLVTMPYSLELNDITVVALQDHRAQELVDRVKLTADRLVAEAADPGPLGGAKVMCVALHPYLSGVPHRIGALEALLADLAGRPEVVFMQGREILDWYLASGDPT